MRNTGLVAIQTVGVVGLGTMGAGIVGVVARRAPLGRYRAGVAPTPANVAAITAWLAERDLPLADLRAGRQTLEDVFLRLTRDEA